jgi:transaldolase/glucose-6-phosphate isomerase
MMPSAQPKMQEPMNPLKQLTAFGQSPWLDFVSRAAVKSGEITKMVAADGLRGVTSNPSIFEKAMGTGTDYDEQLKSLMADKVMSAGELYETLAIKDIQDVADQLKPVYDATKHLDGYVSLEVSPYLANDTEKTLVEARRLWKTVNRPNLMVKVPATEAGIPAIQTLIGEGININVTLLFSQDAYHRVADAYIAGIETLAKNGGNIASVASVASFFVSRIDTLMDKELAATGKPEAEKLMGQVAIANAKLAYQLYKKLFSSPQWEALKAKGAVPQRLLWASTSTKDKKYSDVRYVEELIGKDTVDTIPPATMDAFRDHGTPRASLEENVEQAQQIMDGVGKVGVSMDKVTTQLVQEGVALFAEAFDKLLGAVEAKRVGFLGDKLNRQSYKLPGDLDQAVNDSLATWTKAGTLRRLWAKDKGVWTGADEDQWLGWLDVVDEQLADLGPLTALRERMQKGGYTHILLLGMGGSSLGPEVFAVTYGTQPGFPRLLVLDSTDPAQIKAVESKIDYAKTLFIVSSKSGSTLEPNIFKAYFFTQAQKLLGDKAAEHFVAVTDPGSNMQKVAEGDKFSEIHYGLKSIGGRYSVLSDFGMVPASAMGIEPGAFLKTTAQMVRACGPTVTAGQNPGVILGTILGVAGNAGRDKVTIVASPKLFDFGAWAEQLIAESTGKIGKGLIPVDAEPLGEVSAYGQDRVFVYLRLAGNIDQKQESLMAALEQAGHPVVRIDLASTATLGQEFLRWEIAIAVAGSILGINPFNQPDVEASKIETKKLTTAYESSGSLPPESPFFEVDGIKLYTDEKNAAAIKGAAKEQSLKGYLKAHFDRVKAGDYVGFLAYLAQSSPHNDAIQAVRAKMRDAKKVATVVGFGPRFLHSTGQAYKGGPNSGVFLQITADDKADLAVPGAKYTFGVVKAAQARGDFDVLAERGRRALRVHLPADVEAGLKTLSDAIAAVI